MLDTDEKGPLLAMGGSSKDIIRKERNRLNDDIGKRWTPSMIERKRVSHSIDALEQRNESEMSGFL